MLRWLKGSIAVAAAGPLIGLVLWYAISFLPNLGELNSISSRGYESIESIERVFYPLAVAGETIEGLRSYAMRQAYWSLEYEENPGRMLSWHANNILWRGASHLHFNEHEIFGLWVECALSRCSNGLNTIARTYFGKEMVNLSENELVALVAIVRSPSRYAPGTEFGERRTNEILERAKNHNPALTLDVRVAARPSAG